MALYFTTFTMMEKSHFETEVEDEMNNLRCPPGTNWEKYTRSRSGCVLTSSRLRQILPIP